jgi:hypothetical protein
MKKANKFLFLICTALVYALANVILFLTVPDGKTSSKVFWLVWTFMTPVSLLATVGLFLWCTRKSGNDFVSLTICFYLIGIFTAAYFAVGFFFAYLPWKNITLPLILDLAITVAFIVSVIYFLRGGEYVRAEEKLVKEKVLTIRLLKADVDECESLAKSESLKAALQALSNDVRFSDPMSHPSLAGAEGEIFSLVAEIASKIKQGEEDGVETLVQDAQNRLKARNARCLILK